MSDSFFTDLTHPQPLLIVLSGTSGAGKDAVIRELKKRDLPLHFVVTATSREPRQDEVNGREYYFYSPEEFQERIERGEFIENAMVYGEHKGIPRSEIEEALKSGRDVVLKIDYQGAATIRRLYPQALLIFIMPGSIEELRKRLKERNSETEKTLKVRIETVYQEARWLHIFDYYVMNEDNFLERAADDIEQIINVEHHRINPRKIL